MYYSFGSLEVNYQYLFFYNVKVFIACIYAYFYTRLGRKNFFHHQKEKEKEHEKFLWLQSVLENMNSGFILIKKDIIEYMNCYMVDLFYKESQFSNQLQKNRKAFNSENLTLINLNINNIEKKENEKLEKVNLENFEKEKIINSKNLDEEHYVKYEKAGSTENQIKKTIILENENESKKLENKIELDPQELNYGCSEQIKLNSNEILKELFKGIEFSEYVTSTLREKNKNEAQAFASTSTNDASLIDYKDFLQILKSKILTEENFLFIGTKEIKKKICENKNINNNVNNNLVINENNLYNNNNDTEQKRNEEDYFYFEISIRYYINQDAEENFEILFNDVTKVKLKEKRNAEFKYRTVFFSKVAHEFKNPLICIIEIIDQLTELKKNSNPNAKDDKVFNELFLQVKGISNYLLILVKDLDYFCISNVKLKLVLEYEKCNLDELIQFVSDIGITLLKRAQKKDRINFVIDKDPNLNVLITTDEIKLKQILINLLSNSVKFTHKGEIRLHIANNPISENDVDIRLTDTGIGIKNENLNYSLFQKNVDKSNNIGAGLGLFIVSELTGQIGTKINISSELGQGSEFRFTVKNKDEMLLNNNINKKINDSKENEEAEEVFEKKVESRCNNSSNKNNKNKRKKKSIDSPFIFKASASYNNHRPIGKVNYSSFMVLNNSPVFPIKDEVKSDKPNNDWKCKSEFHLQQQQDNTGSSNNKTMIICENNLCFNTNQFITYKNKYKIYNNSSCKSSFSNNTEKLSNSIIQTKSQNNSASLICLLSKHSLNYELEQFKNINYSQNNNFNFNDLYSDKKYEINEYEENAEENILCNNNSDNNIKKNFIINFNPNTTSTDNNNNKKKMKYSSIINMNTIPKEHEKQPRPQKSSLYKNKNKYNSKENKLKNHQIEFSSEGESEIIRFNLKGIYVIVVDDEDLTRQSTIRMIRRYFEMNNLSNKFELIIQEANDGLDCLAKFYNLISDGIELYCIISDESMYFMNGSECSLVIRKVIQSRRLKIIPFYIVSAYPKENFEAIIKKSVDNLFNKPINFYNVSEIFGELILSLRENNYSN